MMGRGIPFLRRLAGGPHRRAMIAAMLKACPELGEGGEGQTLSALRTFTPCSAASSQSLGVLGVMEDNMLSRLVSGGVLGALAGAAMLVVLSGPSSAFTLSSPSLERPVATAGIQQVYYYYRRYYRRPYYYHHYYRPYYHPYYYHPYYRSYYHPYYYHHYYRPYYHPYYY
jgi:hypothetical protein